MTGLIASIVRSVLRQLGFKGVSVMALVVLLLVAMYVHRLASVGGTVVKTSSTAAHDVKIIAVVLALLLVAGVFKAQPARAQSLLDQALHWFGQLDLQTITQFL